MAERASYHRIQSAEAAEFESMSLTSGFDIQNTDGKFAFDCGKWAKSMQPELEFDGDRAKQVRGWISKLEMPDLKDPLLFILACDFYQSNSKPVNRKVNNRTVMAYEIQKYILLIEAIEANLKK